MSFSAHAPLELNDAARSVAMHLQADKVLVVVVMKDGSLGIGRHRMDAHETMNAMDRVRNWFKRVQKALKAAMR